MSPHNIESGTHKTLHYLLLGLQVNLQMIKTFAFVKLISTKSQNLYIYRTCMFEKAILNEHKLRALKGCYKTVECWENPQGFKYLLFLSIARSKINVQQDFCWMDKIPTTGTARIKGFLSTHPVDYSWLQRWYQLLTLSRSKG